MSRGFGSSSYLTTRSHAGLAAMLALSGCEIAGQVAGEGDLVEQASIFRPDAVLWDLGWQYGDDMAQRWPHPDQRPCSGW
jgi:hypothetical protein